ncbi:MAG: PD40 domain-containing protein [Fidelibacterota bacterium]|nr:MAG: PD40 domain-containing protein [Candidatus Neomarinimicrobiota bacterium]
MIRSVLFLLAAATVLPAQSFWVWNFRTHPELKWQVISSEHFNIYYHQGLEDVAQRGAAIAEQVYQPIMDQLQLEDFGKTDMVFTAEDEVMNGFALPSDQIFIWAYQNDAVGWFTGSEKWLQAVIAHEFQHVALTHGLRTWWGTWNLLLVPMWFIEGLAEYYTEQWRVGRSDSRMKVHTYRNTIQKLDPHDAGYAKVLYLADKYGDSTLAKLVHYRDEVKLGDRKLLTLPYFFGRAFKEVTGQSVAHFNEEWRRVMNTYYYSYRGQKEAVDEVGDPLVIPKLAAIRGIAIAPDSSRIAVVGRSDKDMGDWGLYVISTDSTHKRTELHYGRFNGNPVWSPDGTMIAVSEYHRGRHGSLLWDIRLVDVERRKATWLTRDARASDPAWSPDGRYVLYAAHPGQTTNLYITDRTGEHITRLTAFSGDVQIQDPVWSPDGERIAFTIQGEDGDVDIALVGRDGREYRKVTRDAAEDLAPLWSADGQWIIFTSFRNSTPNLYRIPVGGGEILPMTDVAEGIYTTQVIPTSGEVVAMTLGDVDTVRVRRLPFDRQVEASDSIAIRGVFTRWRQGQPDLPLPEVDLDEVPALDGPRPYRSWRTWRPVVRMVIPDVYGIGGFGYWQDALGKNQLMLLGETFYENWDWGGILSWTNARLAPFLVFTGYRDYKFMIRGYGDSYLLEVLRGLEISALYPFSFGNRLSAEHLFRVTVGAFYRRPMEDVPWDEGAILGVPEEVREGVVSVRYRWKSQRPHRRASFLPPQGTGLRLQYDLHSSALYGDVDYSRLELDMFMHYRIAKGPLVLFTRLVGTQQDGEVPTQDRIGLLTDAPVYLNPGSVVGLLGDFIVAPEVHSLRGLATSKLGDRVLSGTVELRIPLIEKPLVQVLGIGLGQFTAAVFTDFGLVRRSAEGSTDSRMTQGMEIKGNIVIGKLPVLTLAYGQAGDQEAWEDGAAITYMQLGLVSPF